MLVVDDGHARRDWAALGVDAVLPDQLDRSLLLAALAESAQPLRGPEVEPGSSLAPAPAGWRGRLVAVTGPAGGGSSTIAMALAQGLAATAGQAGMVLLADLALHADQALLHDAGDVVPGVQELADAHRGGHARRSTRCGGSPSHVDGSRLPPAARPAPPSRLDRAATPFDRGRPRRPAAGLPPRRRRRRRRCRGRRRGRLGRRRGPQPAGPRHRSGGPTWSWSSLPRR